MEVIGEAEAKTEAEVKRTALNAKKTRARRVKLGRIKTNHQNGRVARNLEIGEVEGVAAEAIMETTIGSLEQIPRVSTPATDATRLHTTKKTAGLRKLNATTATRRGTSPQPAELQNGKPKTRTLQL